MPVIEIVSKPTRKRALLWTGDNLDEVRAFVPAEALTSALRVPDADAQDLARLTSLSLGLYNDEEKQTIDVPIGHYIIQGVNGEFYPCSPDVLAKSYDVLQSLKPKVEPRV